MDYNQTYIQYNTMNIFFNSVDYEIIYQGSISRIQSRTE